MPDPSVRSDKHKQQAYATDCAVGDRIFECRVAAGWTQTDLADAIGLTQQQIQKYETGANRVTAGRLVQIATALRQPVAAFFGEGPRRRKAA